MATNPVKRRLARRRRHFFLVMFSGIAVGWIGVKLDLPLLMIPALAMTAYALLGNGGLANRFYGVAVESKHAERGAEALQKRFINGWALTAAAGVQPQGFHRGDIDLLVQYLIPGDDHRVSSIRVPIEIKAFHDWGIRRWWGGRTQGGREQHAVTQLQQQMNFLHAPVAFIWLPVARRAGVIRLADDAFVIMGAHRYMARQVARRMSKALDAMRR
jgi:hypothetical protein